MDATRHPSEYFIKYLLTLPQPEAQDDNWICTGVQRIGYPPPAVPYISLLRQSVMADFPVDYAPQDRYNRQSVKYLRNHGIWSLHNPSPDTQDAVQLLADIPVRKVLEQLLLGRLDPKEVASRVNSRFRRFITADAVMTYSHYFYNCSLMKSADWVSFFERYDRTEQQRSMAIVQGGSGMALHKAGFRQEIETKDMLRDMLETINFDFKEWKNAPLGKERTMAFATLAKAATGIDERLSESSTAVRDHLAIFKQWQMTHAPSSVKGIEEIAPHGNFSESGAELKELPEKTK